MIILHFDLQPQFKYMNYFMYTSHNVILPKPGFRARMVVITLTLHGLHTPNNNLVNLCLLQEMFKDFPMQLLYEPCFHASFVR